MKDIDKQELKMAFAGIEQIFMLPPASEAEFQQRISAIDPEAARQVLATLLREGEVERAIIDPFFSLAEEFGLANRYPGVLVGVVNDRNRCNTDRRLAMNLLLSIDPEIAERSGLGLTAEEFMELMTGADSQIFAEVLEAAHGAIGVADLMLDAGPEASLDLFEDFEYSRVRSATPAALTYRHALRSGDLVYLHEQMLGAIVAEGGDLGAHVLEELLEYAPDQQARFEVQAALMKVKTRAMETLNLSSASGPEAAAFLSNCDGQGAFVLLVRCRAGEGLYNIADVCIRAAADIRDAFTVAQRTQEDFDEMMDMLGTEAGTTFVRLPLRHAADILEAAIERTQAVHQLISADMENTLLFTEWAIASGQEERNAEFVGDETLPEVTGAVSRKDAESLFSESVYESWFFDAGDLSGVGSEWSEEELKTLDPMRSLTGKMCTTELPARVGAMALHMAWWHLWRGEDDYAAVCAGTARELKDGFSDSAVMASMLYRSVMMNKPDEERDAGPVPRTFGDPKQRQMLQVECFPRLQRPKGKHLAFLDLTEIAMMILDDVLSEFPGEFRPRDTALPKIAFAIAKPSAEMIIEGHDPISLPRDERRYRRMENAVRKHASCSAEESHHLWNRVALELTGFVSSICRNCPVQCFDRPTANMASAFFSPIHPAYSDQVDSGMLDEVYEQLAEDIVQEKLTTDPGNIVPLPARKDR